MRDGFVSTLISLFAQEKRRPRLMISELERLFQIKASVFWENHFSFRSVAPPNLGVTFLIGRKRARDIILNIILPGLIAYARETDDRRLKSAVRMCICNIRCPVKTKSPARCGFVCSAIKKAGVSVWTGDVSSRV
ncbi:MAG: DUF2851 family protein [candidate division KSB1 bacterium]|nr:DUF2851 family protein [candidate division KSB1 bacterium]